LVSAPLSSSASSFAAVSLFGYSTLASDGYFGSVWGVSVVLGSCSFLAFSFSLSFFF